MWTSSTFLTRFWGNTESEKEEDEGYIPNWAREAEGSSDHTTDMAEIMAEFANINFAEMVDIPDDLR